MDSTNETIDGWIHRLSGGDPRAAERAFAAYFEPLVRAVRQKLGTAPRREVDEEDVALSAMESFLRRAADGRFPQLNDREDLWKILITIASRKVAMVRRRQLAQKRGAGAIRGESVFANAGEDGDFGLGDVLGVMPSNELVVETAELLKRLLDDCNDPLAEQVVSLRLAGYTNAEISAETALSTRTVERKLQTIREKWKRVHAEE